MEYWHVALALAAVLTLHPSYAVHEACNGRTTSPESGLARAYRRIQTQAPSLDGLQSS